ncbi:MAG TPA: hypothetical protein VJN18_26975 [Polyangiaceae bacterium]|nr:hypothetical protein [Polyangiaceae bacterium]
MDEGHVVIDADEVAAAADDEGLLNCGFEDVIGFFDPAVLVGFTGLDASRPKPVMVEHAGEALVELAPALGELVRGSGKIVAAQHLGHAAKSPEGVLQTADERLEGFTEGERDRPPAAERHQKLEQQVREELAGNPNTERGAVGEVDGGLSTRQVLLLEEDLALGAVQRAPVTHTPLQCPQVLVGEALAVLAAQLSDNCRRLENALLIALQERHHLGVPDGGESVLTRAPVPGLLRLRRQRPGLPGVRAPRAYSGRRCGGLNSLSFSHFQPQKPNLLVRDHRTPEASATWPKLLDRDHRTRRQHAPDSANLIVVDLQE